MMVIVISQPLNAPSVFYSLLWRLHSSDHLTAKFPGQKDMDTRFANPLKLGYVKSEGHCNDSLV